MKKFSKKQCDEKAEIAAELRDDCVRLRAWAEAAKWEAKQNGAFALKVHIQAALRNTK